MLRPLTDQEFFPIPYQRCYYFDHMDSSLLLKLSIMYYSNLFLALSIILTMITNIYHEIVVKPFRLWYNSPHKEVSCL